MESTYLVKELLCKLGQAICVKVHQTVSTASLESLSAVHAEGEDDTIYQIDREVEDIIVPIVADFAAQIGGVVLMAEGISDPHDPLVFPSTMSASEAKWRIIMDPIDGTRGIMYDKRSAFFLAGAAPNNGDGTRIQDITVAVMTELPTSKACWADTLWAIKGEGAHAFSTHLYENRTQEKKIQPSKAKQLLGGFGQIARFFPPGRGLSATIEDEMIETLYPDAPEGKTILFEDQYISSGGQLYELLMGHDRFIADIRVSLYAYLKKSGKKIGHVCHPYDVCTFLIGYEAGIILTDIHDQALDIPMDLLHAVEWIGYANKDIHNEIQPVLYNLLHKYEILA